MKEQQITETLKWLQQTGQSVVEFTTEQAPLYCQEVINWHFYSNLGYTIFCLMGVIGGLFLIGPFTKAISSPDTNPKNVIKCVLGLIYLPFFIFASISIFKFGNQVLKAKFAPRMVIIEHLQEKIK